MCVCDVICCLRLVELTRAELSYPDVKCNEIELSYPELSYSDVKCPPPHLPPALLLQVFSHQAPELGVV